MSENVPFQTTFGIKRFLPRFSHAWVHKETTTTVPKIKRKFKHDPRREVPRNSPQHEGFHDGHRGTRNGKKDVATHHKG